MRKLTRGNDQPGQKPTEQLIEVEMSQKRSCNSDTGLSRALRAYRSICFKLRLSRAPYVSRVLYDLMGVSLGLEISHRR